jgi:hypothetical protein
VAKKGANCPIFEGNIPPKKMYPQKWTFIDGHSMKAVSAKFFSVISLLREDPLSPGMLDMFFF